MNSVGYAFEEALVSLRRSGRSALISVGTIAIAFVALGGFLLVSVNVQQAIDRWLEAAELSVYLQEDVSDETRAALEQFLRAQPVVLAVEFISKARAIERFRADFPELNDVTASLADNPFPASLEVRLRTDPTSGADADALARDLGGREGVADVRYDRQWLARLQTLVTAGRVAAALAAGVLMLGAAFTVAAVVRLSLHARRDELDIMQLVGAPLSFIRGPSVVEGVLLGGAGAAVALVGLWALYLAVGRWLGGDLAGIIGAGQLRFLGVREVAMLLGGGLGIGAVAGALVSRSVK
jgi:cell division transport system permease protein